MQTHNSITIPITVAIVAVAFSHFANDALCQDALSISIATVSHTQTDTDDRCLPVREGQHFYVVITNNSNQAQNLWESWNSWGFFNLRFDILDGQGVVQDSIVKTPDTCWTMNFPSYTTLKPKQHFVIEVDLSKPEWVVARKERPYTPFAQTDYATNKGQLRIHALFEIPKDNETEKQSVWVGKIQTEPETFQIFAKNK